MTIKVKKFYSFLQLQRWVVVLQNRELVAEHSSSIVQFSPPSFLRSQLDLADQNLKQFKIDY